MISKIAEGLQREKMKRCPDCNTIMEEITYERYYPSGGGYIYECPSCHTKISVGVMISRITKKLIHKRFLFFKWDVWENL